MSTTSVPPRFVPTLTDVVRPSAHTHNPQFKNLSSASVHVRSFANSESTGQSKNTGDLPPSDDLLVKRVMQQVDIVLERRLREALGRIILEQTENLAPKLRSEIEQVVKETIAYAVAQELEQR